MKQKWYYFIGGTVIFLFVVLSFSFSGYKSYVKEIDYAKYTALLQANDIQLIYFSSDDCEGCEAQKPILENVASMYDLVFYQLSLNKLTDSELREFVSLLGEDITSVITPSLLLVKDGKLVAYETGFLDRDSLVSFLTKQDVLMGLAKIDFDTYFDFLLGKDKILLYLGSTDCSYCKEYKPLLEEVLQEYKLIAYYLDKATLSDEQKLDLMNSLDVLYDGIATPQLLVFQEGNTIGQLLGIKTKEQIVAFLTEKGYIEIGGKNE